MIERKRKSNLNRSFEGSIGQKVNGKSEIFGGARNGQLWEWVHHQIDVEVNGFETFQQSRGSQLKEAINESPLGVEAGIWKMEGIIYGKIRKILFAFKKTKKLFKNVFLFFHFTLLCFERVSFFRCLAPSAKSRSPLFPFPDLASPRLFQLRTIRFHFKVRIKLSSFSEAMEN